MNVQLLRTSGRSLQTPVKLTKGYRVPGRAALARPLATPGRLSLRRVSARAETNGNGNIPAGSDNVPAPTVAAPTPSAVATASLSIAPPSLQTLEAYGEDDSVRPLKQALDQALAHHMEAIRVREALEAEAQEVAQLAVEAVEGKEKAKTNVYKAMEVIEELTRQQQQWLDKSKTLREKLKSAAEPAAAVEGAEASAAEAEVSSSSSDLDEAERQVADFTAKIDIVRMEVESLVEKAGITEAAANKAEEVAAAAMAAAERAVVDEMEAVAVVKETQKALSKILSELKAIESGMKPPAPDSPSPATAPLAPPASSTSTPASPTPAGVSPSLSMDESTERKAKAVEAAAVAVAAAMGSKEAPAPPSSAPSKESKPEKTPAAMKGLNQYVVVAAVVAVAAAAAWFLRSPAGQPLVVGASELMSHLVERFGPFEIHEGEKGLLETIWLLLTSIISVPLVVKLLPGGNPVLGYLLGGALVGPHALGLIHDVSHISHVAELGVVFLLFNIGLELSVDRLQSMAKYVFGMGTAQVVLTVLGAAGIAMATCGLTAPSAIILGGALAMSSTAVAIQVLEDRGEMGSRHGRATFSVLLLQDLAVVVLLMLIPLLAPSESGAAGGVAKIAQALAAAGVKAAVCIAAIIAGGRVIVQPLYKKIANFSNAEIFAATTLLVVLGTSLLTQLAGLSLALGAFLAGLLLSETEYALQVESDIAPYKGLLMGLFFMSVGMNISAQLFIAQWKSIIAAITVLIAGKLAVMALVGPWFGLSRLAAVRAGLLLAPGGEFAFVAFGEAVSRGVLPISLTQPLYLVVALSMALTPYLAMLGSKMGSIFEKSDMKALQPQPGEVKELRQHVIIAGYGRVGQIIAQMLSEQLIPFVALEVRSDRVQAGRNQDLPVYFGDAGSPAVLHSVGAERAACAVISMDTPGANYRAVYAMKKNYPHVKTYVRAHDVNHGLVLEKAGATAVVPETLEPSLQLAAAVLDELEYPDEEVTSIVDNYRKKHLAELQALSSFHGTSLGYGYHKDKAQDKTSLKTGASGEQSSADKDGKDKAKDKVKTPVPALVSPVMPAAAGA